MNGSEVGVQCRYLKVKMMNHNINIWVFFSISSEPFILDFSRPFQTSCLNTL